jgi:hypothetical protein
MRKSKLYLAVAIVTLLTGIFAFSSPAIVPPMPSGSCTTTVSVVWGYFGPYLQFTTTCS